MPSFRTLLAALVSAVAFLVPAGAASAATDHPVAAAATHTQTISYERWIVVIDTDGMSDYEVARTEVQLGRLGQQAGLSVVQWHLGIGGVVVEGSARTVITTYRYANHVKYIEPDSVMHTS
ncbi:hypothetical protein [Luteipulveratus flavus]|uniref:Inhibitor I9 domain-containing protein n=1 Tax=Luteipulveratus flavus TaxID=3031728 RepID=A0ABT6C8K2_9MICO|nr:hypothetical protein [Luteipulveratus sp. YIM 133296]MDF8265259.1 hypothetical protein [Luteipulveratus sp. YIM 133296]